jgi:hypothetical protein
LLKEGLEKGSSPLDQELAEHATALPLLEEVVDEKEEEERD